MITIAAFVGGGGLGRLLIAGRAAGNEPQMFAGAFLIAVVAIVLHLLLSLIGWRAARHARPGGTRSPGDVLVTA
jgi:osmoprotectant transport system permease protein